MAALIDYLVPEDENPHEARGPEDIHGNGNGEFSSAKIKSVRRPVRPGHRHPQLSGRHRHLCRGLDSLTLGTSIALAVAVHNIPEGIAVAVPLYYGTGSRKKAVFYPFCQAWRNPSARRSR